MCRAVRAATDDELGDRRVWERRAVGVMGLGAAGCEVRQGCPAGWLLNRYLLTSCYKGCDRDQSFFKSLVSDSAIYPIRVRKAVECT